MCMYQHLTVLDAFSFVDICVSETQRVRETEFFLMQSLMFLNSFVVNVGVYVCAVNTAESAKMWASRDREDEMRVV